MCLLDGLPNNNHNKQKLVEPPTRDQDWGGPLVWSLVGGSLSMYDNLIYYRDKERLNHMQEKADANAAIKRAKLLKS